MAVTSVDRGGKKGEEEPREWSFSPVDTAGPLEAWGRARREKERGTGAGEGQGLSCGPQAPGRHWGWHREGLCSGSQCRMLLSGKRGPPAPAHLGQGHGSLLLHSPSFSETPTSPSLMQRGASFHTPPFPKHQRAHEKLVLKSLAKFPPLTLFFYFCFYEESHQVHC